MIKLNSLKLIMVGNSNTEKIENYCANHHIKKKKRSTHLLTIRRITARLNVLVIHWKIVLKLYFVGVC